jgi:exopolyphosphatase/guanosine-5'-triphosphate,3'-diphosphate pyrophosphatase
VDRYAVIDVGTNSVKFHLAEQSSDGAWRRLADRGVVTRLGEGLSAQGGQFTEGAMARTLDALAGMVDEARRAGVAGLAAAGTMAFRTASNGAAFIEQIERRTGLRVEILSGEQEGRLAYLAAESGLGWPPGSLAVFDTGGGSTQFTFGEGATVRQRFSVNVGAVRLMETHGLDGPVEASALQQVLDGLGTEFACLDNQPAPDQLVGIGGGVVTLTAVMLALVPYEPDRVQGARLPRDEVWRQIEWYRVRPAAARCEIRGLPPHRSDVILAGACIVWTILAKLHQASLTVSDRGLRHGLLEDRFGRRRTQPERNLAT